LEFRTHVVPPPSTFFVWVDAPGTDYSAAVVRVYSWVSNQRNARNVTERNEMTSLLDRPITAASDDGVCR